MPYTRVSKSSLHGSICCASSSGLIILLLVFKCNQTSSYDTTFNPLHAGKFITRAFETQSNLSVPAPHQYFTICKSPCGPTSPCVLILSSACDLKTHRKTQLPPGVSASSLCPSSCILSLCSRQHGSCVLYMDPCSQHATLEASVGMQSNANHMLVCTVLSLRLPDVCRLSVMY